MSKTQEQSTALTVAMDASGGSWKPAEPAQYSYESVLAMDVSGNLLRKLTEGKAANFPDRGKLEGIVEQTNGAKICLGSRVYIGPNGSGVVMSAFGDDESMAVVVCSLSDENPQLMGLSIIDKHMNEAEDYLILPDTPRESVDIVKMMKEKGYPYTRAIKTKDKQGMFEEGLQIFDSQGKKTEYALASFLREDRAGVREWQFYKKVN